MIKRKRDSGISIADTADILIPLSCLRRQFANIIIKQVTIATM